MKKYSKWFPSIISLSAWIYFIGQMIIHANNQISVLDEGAYLLKGIFYLRGDYWPFQDYGPLTNHMPLSFLIPGAIQMLFGSGLRTARYFSIFLGALFLIGNWVIGRRFSGRWGAAILIWVIAINPATVKMYSLATSQVLAATMLIWTLVLILGRDRSQWELLAGTGLAAILALTRINLLLVLPLVVFYVWWQFGRREGLKAAILGGSIFLIGQLVFFPGILKLWTYWLPETFFPFLEAWRAPEGIRKWDPQTETYSRIISFFHGLRFHFLAVIAAIGAWSLWPKKSSWKSVEEYKISAWISILFLLLMLEHMVASLGFSYCVFCFPVYQSFYIFTGLILFLSIYSFKNGEISNLRQGILILVVLILLGGIGYSAYEDLGHSLLAIQVPRIKSFAILPGQVELWGLISNRFGLSYEYLLRVLPTIAGIIFGVILFISFYIVHWWLRKNQNLQVSYRIFSVVGLLLVGFLLSPTQLLGGAYDTFDSCEGNMISSYEEVGKYLASEIPSGSSIYWQGGLSVVPLLYLDNVSIFPSQINQDYTFFLRGDDSELERYGYWSENLGKKWLYEADYALMVDRYYVNWAENILQDGAFYIELESPPSLNSCDQYAEIRLFKRIKDSQ